MKKADILPRLAQLEDGDQDNLQITLLLEKMFSKTALVFELISQNLNWIRAKHSKQDPSVIKVLREQLPSWRDNNRVITFQERINIPQDDSLRGEIIKDHHDNPATRHPGHYKTLELVSQNYYWPVMSKEIWKYVKSCDTCQRSKPLRLSPAAPLHPHDMPGRPWDVISMDLIGPLPESQGKNANLIVVDRFLKQIHVILTTVMLSAKETARLLRDNIF